MAELRKKGLSLGKEISENYDNLVLNPASMVSFIQRNAELTQQAKSAMVAQHLNKNDAAMAGILVSQAKKLTSLSAMPPTGFMKALIERYPSGDGSVDWVKFGTHASSYFREPPAAFSMNHLCVRHAKKRTTPIYCPPPHLFSTTSQHIPSRYPYNSQPGSF